MSKAQKFIENSRKSLRKEYDLCLEERNKYETDSKEWQEWNREVHHAIGKLSILSNIEKLLEIEKKNGGLK